MRDHGTHTRVLPKGVLNGKTTPEIEQLVVDKPSRNKLYICEFIVPPGSSVRVVTDRSSGHVLLYEIENAPRTKAIKTYQITHNEFNSSAMTARTGDAGIIREFKATRADRFIRVYDKINTFMNGDTVYPAEIIKGKTKKETLSILNALGYSQIYICDVHPWGDTTVKERKSQNGHLPNYIQIDAGMYVNERKITPPTATEIATYDAYRAMLNNVREQVSLDQAAIIGTDISKRRFLGKSGITVPEMYDERKFLASEMPFMPSNSFRGLPTAKAQFMLFDPSRDKLDDEWIHIIANFYDDGDSILFKPEISNQLYAYSALNHEGFLGACAALHLGKKFLFGHEREIDIDVAANWFEIALDKGHSLAKLFLSDIYQNYHPHYGSAGFESFTERVDSLLEDEQVVPLLYRHTTGKLARGTDAVFQQTAVDTFHKLANGLSPLKITGQWHIALRSFIGIGLERNLTTVQRYIDQLPDIDDAVSSDITFVSEKGKLQKIIDSAQTPELRDAYKRAAKAVCNWYANEDNGALLDAEIAATPIHMQRAIRDTLWISSDLAKKEGWRIRSAIGRKLYDQRMQQVAITYDELKESALIMGPRYNRIGHNGLPVLGVWEPPSPDRSDAMREMTSRGSYVPPPGAGIYRGLKTTPDGFIRFNCSMSGQKPALLTQEDFDVAMLLAFSDDAKVIWPSLSIESVDKSMTDGHDLFVAKEFSPDWMGHTDFGRTMYITDVLCGALAWNPTSFPVASGNTEHEKNRYENITKFLRNIEWTGGRHTRSSSARVMLRTEHHHIEGLAPKLVDGQHIWDIGVKDVRMRVDGSYILRRTDGDENRLVALNDSTYHQGAVAEKLTKSYDYIAELMPVFERARQLMGLLYSLSELRSAGFTPNPRLIDALQGKHEAYAQRPPLPRNQLWIDTFPHHS